MHFDANARCPVNVYFLFIFFIRCAIDIITLYLASSTNTQFQFRSENYKTKIKTDQYMGMLYILHQPNDQISPVIHCECGIVYVQCWTDKKLKINSEAYRRRNIWALTKTNIHSLICCQTNMVVAAIRTANLH